MISIALLGAGRIGQIHGRTIAASKRARLAGIADPFPDGANALSAATGAPVRPIDELIADKAIDAVLIATPTDTHADYIDRAAAAGKAILCEKPVDLSSGRIKETLARVKKAGVTLMIGFNRRFDPNFAALQKRLADGAAGNVELVSILSRDPAPPPVSYIERSGGLFRDMMIHDFDMARFLLGEEPVEVFALGSSLVDPAIGKAGDVDTAAVLLKTGQRQDLPDFQLPPRHLWLRPAHRGAWLEGPAFSRQRARNNGELRRRRRRHGGPGAEFLPGALFGCLSQRGRRLHRCDCGREEAVARWP